MDKNSISKTPIPTPETSPEEDATLLAIEALEARTVDPNPKPWTPTPRTAHVLPAKPSKMDHTEPLKTSKPVAITKIADPVSTVVPQQIIRVRPEPQAAIAKKPEPVVLKATIAEKPKKPTTPAEEMAEELANAPAMSYFQFFWHQNKPRKPFIIIGIAVIVIGLVTGAYFVIK